MVKIIKNNDENEFKKSSVSVVDFSATWCGPCKMVAPIVEKLSDEYDGKVDFYNVDVDENGDVASKYGVQNIPTIVFFKDGNEIKREVGFKTENALRLIIDELLK